MGPIHGKYILSVSRGIDQNISKRSKPLQLLAAATSVCFHSSKPLQLLAAATSVCFHTQTGTIAGYLDTLLIPVETFATAVQQRCSATSCMMLKMQDQWRHSS